MKKALFVLAGVAAALPAFSQAQRPAVGLGIAIGDFFPSDTTLRHAFGDNILTFGLSPVSFGRPKTGTLTPTFNIIGADKNGSNFLLVPVTLGYEMHFGDDESSTVPYLRIDAGGAYFNYSVKTSGATISGSRFGGVADAEAGVEIQKNWRLSARYYLFTKESGLSFNGLQLSLTFGLIHF